MEEIIEKVSHDLRVQQHQKHRKLVYRVGGPDVLFIAKIADAVANNRPISTRQSYAITKVLIQHVAIFVEMGWDEGELRRSLAHKQWKKPCVATVEKRPEARYLGDNLIGLSYSSKRATADLAKALGHMWSDDLHIVEVKGDKINTLIKFMTAMDMTCDQATTDFLEECLTKQGDPSLIVMDDNTAICSVIGSNIAGAYLRQIVGVEYL